MSAYPPPDNQPPSYPQPDQPYGAPPNYPQPDQAYGAPPNYGQPGQYSAPPNYAPPTNPYGTSPGYPPPANPYGTPPGYAPPAQPYGAPNYVPPTPYGMPYQVVVPQNNGLAIASLVLGILGLVSLVFFILSPFMSIPAVITGHIALARIKANPMLPGRGQALAGLIMGYISIGLLVLFIVIVIIAAGSGSINTTH